MASTLNDEQRSIVKFLLGTGKTIKEISKFTELDRAAIAEVARELDIEPASKVQQRAKQLFDSEEGLSYQQVAESLRSESYRNDDGKPIHYLTVSTWVGNFGWRWGGSDDGVYEPPSGANAQNRSRYSLRVSRKVNAEINSERNVNIAAEAAYGELENDRTRIVAVAIIKGAAKAGVTDIAAVKKTLFANHGESIRSARI